MIEEIIFHLVQCFVLSLMSSNYRPSTGPVYSLGVNRDLLAGSSVVIIQGHSRSQMKTQDNRMFSQSEAKVRSCCCTCRF